MTGVGGRVGEKKQGVRGNWKFLLLTTFNMSVNKYIDNREYKYEMKEEGRKVAREAW